MIMHADKRLRTDLDLFVLALVAEGLKTPYEMQARAGLSPGATIPVLERLSQQKLLRREKAGARNRSPFGLTAAGTRWLQTGWRELVESEPLGPPDAILRVALLAIVIGDDRKAAREYLKRAAESLLTEESGACTDMTPSTGLASRYKGIRETLSAVLRRAEGEFFREAGAAVGAPTPKRNRPAANSSKTR
jgi:DNA-binding PadR family transcriptional regulator